MDINLTHYLATMAYNSAYIGLFIAIIAVAKLSYNLATPYNTTSQLTDNANSALGLSIGGYLGAITIIYGFVLAGPSQGLLRDLMNVSLYSVLGMVLLTCSRILNDKLLLRLFCNQEQLINQQNEAVGLVQAANYMAAALIIGGALTGEGSWLSAIVFYFLGQLMLIIFAKGYDHLTAFNLHEQLEKGNKAVALSFSGTMLALAIILCHALIGGFHTWQQSLSLFFIDALFGFLILPIVRYLVDKIIFSKISLDQAMHDKNTAVAVIESSIAICVAVIITIAI
ncbi:MULTISPECIES: DUF350 domain-containing protein [Pseudoalteromonas]|uniref:DUF350 domain-containing protein n=1 Tax=Pseudoalteromonas TaxID=53246 RepID=UPI0006CA0B07|nr:MULTISPECIES: DUF350 domain-containing protein [Pseudoalteromonas]KPM80135.1 hypothetical protein AOG26_02270 [Pseudoalteromonas sp. UCD-33C]MCG9732492.1 DUF350 domain-containing protein [Pseudoalteromonas shioyasakiensis]